MTTTTKANPTTEEEVVATYEISEEVEGAEIETKEQIQGRISLWKKTAKTTGKIFHSGVIQIPPTVMDSLIELHEAGEEIELDVAVFPNSSLTKDAPTRTGTVKPRLPEPDDDFE